jgi:hypothetical protein
MTKNRKKQAAAVRLSMAAKAILACVFLGGAGVGYVGLKNQIHGLSLEIEQKEKHLQALRVESARQARQLATLRSPQFLHTKAGELNLGLMPPQRSQIVTLTEPPVPAAALSAETAQEMARRLQLAESGQRTEKLSR